jgi:hypothetical protein
VSAPTERELYEDWRALIEFSRPVPADVELILEAEVYVEQTYSKVGSSAGGPRDAGYQEPLIKKPPIPWWFTY